MPQNRLQILALATSIISLPPAHAGTLTGRTVPAPIVGVTLDQVSNPAAELASLQQIAETPTARIVLDKGASPTNYQASINQLRQSAFIMGELADSSAMKSYTVTSITTMARNVTKALAGLVDIWEIGNEVNGDWLGTQTLPKIEAMYNIVAAGGGATALTFFYEGEMGDPHNCISTKNGGNDLFTWIKQNFHLGLPPSQRPAETEKIRLGLNYALISWYPTECPQEAPDWATVYTNLARIFPNAAVGFGELGTPNPQGGSTTELAEISNYYPLAKTLAKLPASYIGGYFWWYFAEEMVPWTKTTLGPALNAAIQN